MENNFRKLLLECLFLMLRPVARYCLKNSIKLQDIVETLKQVLIEVAGKEAERRYGQANMSRISVMTGVHRKDLRRFFILEAPAKYSPSVASRVMVQWQTDPAFTTKSGKPRVLTADSLGSEFHQLVRSVSVDVGPNAVLRELERVGVIERTGKGIRLSGRTYVPKGDVKESFKYLANDTADLMSAVEGNISLGSSSREELPNLHVKIEYDNISLEALPKIRHWLLAQGSNLHRRAIKYLAKYDLDTNPTLAKKQGGGRVVLGSYSLAELSETKSAEALRVA